MDFQEMFRAKSFVNESKNGSCEKYPYQIVFEKFEKHCILFLKEKNDFASLFQTLKRYCVLSSFSLDYEIIKSLGKGHFAEVFLMEKRNTGKKYAVKIFQKDTEAFNKNKVSLTKKLSTKILYFRILLLKKPKSCASFLKTLTFCH